MTLIPGLLLVELLFSVQLAAAVVLEKKRQVLSSDLEPVVSVGKMVMMVFGAEWVAVES